MMNDADFEDQAAIAIVAALVTRDNFHGIPPVTQNTGPAEYADKAYLYARALVERRKKRPKP
jgi:hypothetical protein